MATNEWTRASTKIEACKKLKKKAARYRHNAGFIANITGISESNISKYIRLDAIPEKPSLDKLNIYLNMEEFPEAEPTQVGDKALLKEIRKIFRQEIEALMERLSSESESEEENFE